MKKTLLATAAFVALSTAAPAADLPRRTVAPVVAAPMFTWTGFYVGVNAGYGWGEFKRTANPNPVGFGPDALTVGAFATRTLTADGFVGGAQIGYNYQLNTIVLGLEADFNFSDIKKSVGPAPILGVPAGNFLTSTSRLEWFGTVRPRVGFAIDRLLIYATGGLAFGSVKVNDAFSFVGGPTTGASSSTRTGYAIGAGLEYAFTNNLTIRVEYLFADFGKSNYSGPAVPGFAGTNIELSNKTTLNVVRAGLNYKF